MISGVCHRCGITTCGASVCTDCAPVLEERARIVLALRLRAFTLHTRAHRRWARKDRTGSDRLASRAARVEDLADEIETAR